MRGGGGGGREGVIEFIYYYLEGVRGSHTLMHVGGREGVIEFIIIIWRGFGGLTPSCMWGEGRSN